jgi:hypothetical protein
MFPTMTEATMSSKEIAELTGKKHGHVIRDIKVMMSRLEVDLNHLKDHRGFTCEILLGWEDAITLVSGYSPKARKAIVMAAGRHAVMEAIDGMDLDIPDTDALYVYAIREVDGGRIKIGISKDPERRLKQLQTGSSSELELVAMREATGGFADEKEIHRLNESVRIHGEWFESNASLNGPMGEMKLVEVA